MDASASSADDLNPAERALLDRYLTNLDGRVFALRNLPEVVKGALFSRYSRTEKSLRRVLLEEFLVDPETGIDLAPAGSRPDERISSERAEAFYQRVLVGYGDDSVAELAGAHVAVERVSTLAAKALEDSRIGLSPLEKSTRYVRFDRPGPDGRFLYHRGEELGHPAYEPAMDGLFQAYSEMLGPVLNSVRARFPQQAGEGDRAWRSATRAKAFDLLRGLLPAATLTNLGLYGNGRAFEYLITKSAASDLPEVRALSGELFDELAKVIPAFVRRALDERYGAPAAARLSAIRQRLAELAPREGGGAEGPQVKLIEHDQQAEAKVAAAALYPLSDLAWSDLAAAGLEPGRVLDALLGDRANRRHKAPRALEHAVYTFELTANFAAYRDLQRHRMLTQDRQLLGVGLGYDLPPGLAEAGVTGRFVAAQEAAGRAQQQLSADLGTVLGQYAVPLAYRLRWHVRANLREIFHLCELRTTPQGHPDYRLAAQEMFRRVEEVHPRLAGYARFVDLSQADELERRAAERRLDEKLAQLGGEPRAAIDSS